MRYTQEQAQKIYEQAKLQGLDPNVIMGKMVARGAEFDGVDMNLARKASTIYQEPQVVKEEKAPIVQRVAEKIADFTGGKELAQAGAVALAQPFVSKKIDETQKMQFDIQGKLLERIKEKKANGEDTAQLESALSTLTQEIQDFGQGAEKLLNPNDLTPSKVVGDALQLATTAGGAKLAGAVAGKAKLATTLGQGLIQGAKTGAIGGSAVGAVGGIANELQQDEKTIGSVLGSGLKGALGGAVVGGAVGSIAGGVSGALKGRALNAINKAEKSIIDSVTPNTKNISSKDYEKLLSQGRITPKTATKGSQYILSDAEKQTALKYKELLVNKDPVKNHASIVNEIAKQDENVGNFLRSNNGIFNKGELKNYLKTTIADVADISLDEKVVNNSKKKLIDNFIKSMDKNDMENLWVSRKNFDREIDKAFTGSPTLQNKLKIAFRNGVQDFIAERTPDEVYKQSMKEMSNLFKLRDLVTKKAISEKGQSAIKLWIKENPIKTKIIGIGAPAVVGGAVLLD